MGDVGPRRQFVAVRMRDVTCGLSNWWKRERERVERIKFSVEEAGYNCEY